jgi:ribosomal protein L40E
MTERGSKVPADLQSASASASASSADTARTHDDDVERALGRTVTLALPIASLAVALAVGAVAGVGSALLVIAAGALIGAVGLFWASVRTLSGDAPLTVEFEALSREDRRGGDELDEEKGRLLRALKDLESEHEIGKINDADYQTFVARYREEAKVVMRKMDVEVAPFREQAERLAGEYLKKRGLTASKVERAAVRAPDADEKAAAKAPRTERLLCVSCGASNETDAAFCKQCGSSMRKENGDART